MFSADTRPCNAIKLDTIPQLLLDTFGEYTENFSVCSVVSYQLLFFIESLTAPKNSYRQKLTTQRKQYLKLSAINDQLPALF